MVIKLPGLRMDAYGGFAIVVVYKVGVSNTQETTLTETIMTIFYRSFASSQHHIARRTKQSDHC